MQLTLDSKYVTSSPHIKKRNISTRAIMLDVIIALVPAFLAAIFFFGHMALLNVVYCVVFCVLAEYIYTLVYTKTKPSLKHFKSSSVKDLSCVVTGIVLGLNLPAVVDVWGVHVISKDVIYFSLDTLLACAAASIFAIVFCKMLFGGLGRNFANPAMVARVFLLLSFSGGLIMLYSQPLFGMEPAFHLDSGASWLGLTGDGVYNANLGNAKSLLNLFIGNTASSAVGETCKIAIILGYIYLSIRKRIDWRTPLILMAFVGVFAWLLGFGDSRINYTSVGYVWGYILSQILSGGVMFGAVFMATDYVASPNTFWGNVLYLAFIAFFTMLIRIFSAWHEGFSFALLLGNIITPLIDRFIYPKPFGYVKKAKVSKVVS